MGRYLTQKDLHEHQTTTEERLQVFPDERPFLSSTLYWCKEDLIIPEATEEGHYTARGTEPWNDTVVSVGVNTSVFPSVLDVLGREVLPL